MRSNGFGILALKYFRCYPVEYVGYGMEIQAQLLRFLGEHKWLNARLRTDILLHATSILLSNRGFLSSEMRRGEVG
jgi:hypothetical protein